jgi:hypothetical protein
VELKPGSRLKSAVDKTEVVVVRAPAADVDVRCGGAPMVAAGSDAPDGGAVQAGFDTGTQVGKRYADEEVGIELLCVSPGDGSLSIGETVLPIKGAKPLPSSD